MTDTYPCGISKDELPTVEMCLSYLAEEGVPNNVIDHCMAVEKLALQIAMKITSDEEILTLVSRAALLHDIGRSQTHGLDHAIAGAEILRKRGIDERICLIVERHLGAGILAPEAAEIGLPEKDMMPQTLAEKIVSHADNLIIEVDRHPYRMSMSDAQERAMKNDFETMAKRIGQIHDELSELAGLNIDDIG